MSALTYEQKNSNILSRFESKSSGISSKVYHFCLNDGKAGTLLCMNGETIEQAVAICENQFVGSRLKYVKA